VIVTEPDPDDVRNDGNECTDDLCAGTTPAHAPLPADTPCGKEGLLKCDDTGKCKGCMDDASCQGGPADPCAPITCLQGTCVTNDTPPGTLLPDPTPGDCMAPACDASGLVTNVFAADPPASPSACIASVCVEGAAQTAPRNAGTECDGGVCDGNGTCVGCLKNEDCGGGSKLCMGTTCVDHCTDGQQNHGETAVDCGGGICPGCGFGSPCVVPADCASGLCFDNVCWPEGSGGE
jgi:hypothetical protein